MYKRQFYSLEHGQDGNSASSSSSSLGTASDGLGDGSGAEADDATWPASEHESDEHSDKEEVIEADDIDSDCAASEKDDEPFQACAGAIDGDSSDSEQGMLHQSQNKSIVNQWAEAVDDAENERFQDRVEDSSVIRMGVDSRVLKCRLCPKIVCLSEETMQAHLNSKGHSRSVKKLAEGRLKVQLDSDGEEEEEGETHSERYARTVASAQELVPDRTPRKRASTGRQRQRKRMKRKALLAANIVHAPGGHDNQGTGAAATVSSASREGVARMKFTAENRELKKKNAKTQPSGPSQKVGKYKKLSSTSENSARFKSSRSSLNHGSKMKTKGRSEIDKQVLF